MGFGICTYANCCPSPLPPPPSECIIASLQGVNGFSYINVPRFEVNDPTTTFHFDWPTAYRILFPPDGNDQTRSYDDYFTGDRTRNFAGYMWDLNQNPPTRTCHRYDWIGGALCSYSLGVPDGNGGNDVYPAEEGSDWTLPANTAGTIQLGLCSDNSFQTNVFVPSNLLRIPCDNRMATFLNGTIRTIGNGKSWSRNFSRLGWEWDIETPPGGPYNSFFDYYQACVGHQFSRIYFKINPDPNWFSGYAGFKVASYNHFFNSDIWTPRTDIDGRFRFQIRMVRRERDVDIARLALAADVNNIVGEDDIVIWNRSIDITMRAPTYAADDGSAPFYVVSFTGDDILFDVTEFFQTTSVYNQVIGFYFATAVDTTPGHSISHATGDWKYTIERASNLDDAPIFSGYGTKHSITAVGNLEFV